jgi:hypothetical protein
VSDAAILEGIVQRGPWLGQEGQRSVFGFTRLCVEIAFVAGPPSSSHSARATAQLRVVATRPCASRAVVVVRRLVGASKTALREPSGFGISGSRARTA